ncbi:ribose 5-phosphate isomerase B [candidate division WOR-3 bacterium]|nr:ribose 5-phosphate isomerase B [candidate division WOR-3 bacterium]MCK4527030.1 ribose 5-phosphate isomerase B [candidate division WOR-3 bacterium]
MVIGIGADHRGYSLKQELIKCLKSNGYKVVDFGTESNESVDYPDFAEALAREVAKGEINYGILICNTGIGMSIAANKVKGVYAALVLDKEMAEAARIHNNANILTLSAKRTSVEEAWQMFTIWMESEFEGDRHERRLKKIKAIEDE